ncbi:HEPN domain-containing protein [Erwinia sp. LJJL01]|uniref:HEPN domain-containing protein n=1 Tax=Erwinia sp. LJJL01 TaxID=3391839 RepID=UPI00106041A9
MDGEFSKRGLYFGMSGFNTGESVLSFGEGIELRPTYAHIVTEHILAYEEPQRPGGFYPKTWHATSHNRGVDILAELFIPTEYNHEKFNSEEIGEIIASLFKLYINPQVDLRVKSSKPISSFKQVQSKGGELAAQLLGGIPKAFDLALKSDEDENTRIEWVKDNWVKTTNLLSSSNEFKLAFDTINNVQYIHNGAMALVSVWGALEAIFSPHKAELVFRVSSNLSAYLEPRGPKRLELQKEIVKLYGLRSAAAHGSPKHQVGDVVRTLSLLRRAIIKMIHNEEVPDRELLENFLFVY